MKCGRLCRVCSKTLYPTLSVVVCARDDFGVTIFKLRWTACVHPPDSNNCIRRLMLSWPCRALSLAQKWTAKLLLLNSLFGLATQSWPMTAMRSLMEGKFSYNAIIGGWSNCGDG